VVPFSSPTADPSGPWSPSIATLISGRARLSYRRAAELFIDSTGWTLHHLRHTRIRDLADSPCPLPI